MTSRERFEEWRDIKANFYWTNVTPEQAAEAAWQAAERQALERAAKRAEEKAMDCHTLGNAEEFRELAACIRALMQDAPNLTGKDRQQWESDHYHRALQDPEICKMFGITPPSVASKEEPQ